MTLAAQIMHAAKKTSSQPRSVKKQLTGPQCAEVRRRNAAGESMKSLAREYGVSFKQIADCFV